MEQVGISPKLVPDGRPVAAQSPHAVPWKDLRDWIDLVERRGLLKRIAAPVNLDEELSAITFMATRTETAPALLFENPSGASGAAVLANMLGASATRYALAMGMDEKLSSRAMIAETRRIMQRRIAPTLIDKKDASVNEIVATGADID